MTKIEIFDTEAKRIKKMAIEMGDGAYDEAFVMEAIFDALDRAVKVTGRTAEELIMEYYA